MGDCDRIKSYISEYSENRLDEQTKQQIESHLNVCPDCLTVAQRIPVLQLLLSNLKSKNCSDDFMIKLHQKLQSEAVPQSKNNNLKRYSYVFSFATIVIIIAFGVNSMFTETELPTQVPIFPEKNKTGTNASVSPMANQKKQNSNNAAGLDIKTQAEHNIYADSLKMRKGNEENPKIKYVDQEN